MKTAYLICLIVLAVVLAACIHYAIRCRAKCTESITKLLATAIFAMAFYSLFMLAGDETMATFADGLYFAAAIWLSYFMLKFAIVYTDHPLQYRLTLQLKRTVLTLAVLDTFAMLLNNAVPVMFRIVSREHAGGKGTYYSEHFLAPQYIHLAFCYILIATTAGILLYKTIISASIYKAKYFTILILMLVVILVNAVCYSQKLPIDMSVALYGIMACDICYFALRAVPAGVMSRAQTCMADHIRQGLLCFDMNENCIYMNPSIMDKMECKQENIKDITIAYYREKHASFVKEGKETAHWEEQRLVDNEWMYLTIDYQQLSDENGKNIGYFYVFEDNTKDVLRIQEELYRARHDVLTGLLNREAFFEEADRIIREDPAKPRCMIASDVKDFKLINNLYGQEYGDEVLKMQAELVKKNMTEECICGRIGGDKFAMLIDRENFDQEMFQGAVEEINRRTAEKSFTVHYHIGIYDFENETETAQVLYNRVNLAIAAIHNDYERIFVKYDSDMMDQIMKEKQMVSEFDKAIAEKQFCMFLQPQIDKNDQLIGAEALVRWRHPVKGLIFPNDFIEVFERANLIHRLDIEIWDQAAEKLAEWQAKGIDQVHISVNISTKDFFYLDVYEELVRIVERHGIAPHALKLEITETAVMTDQKKNFQVLNRLKEYGFDLELDDFGSGYSSLNMLKDFSVDVLKIDRMFLRETGDKVKSRVILESVIGMAKQLGMLVVTEGVEEYEQLNSLKHMGCDVFQGYYFDKPIAVNQFEEKYIYV